MIDIPADAYILTTIKRGSVYYFKNEEFASNEPHYFVVLNENPKNGNILILVCATSQVEKRKAIAQKMNFMEGTLVEVSPLDFTFFTKNSLFDCNNVIEINIGSIIEKLSNNELQICPQDMPDKIVNDLVRGVLVSNQVTEGNKKILIS
ncbi:MAG: hypothetical protein MNSN_09430 [Minisyncoccus archaeiphilus]|jgi:hypothetical protein|uniref:hypothetical protein n=1 Tax=Minisyncoccus archaeiphilus TaxID=3238481 RepID=UPI002B0ED5DF|nr:MAG: hypothetical protein MNSN_09430 [Candidatus Parcubacteria bacterium]